MFRDKRGELTNEYIYDIHQNSDGTITYDLQVGGECPVIYENVPEEKVIKRPVKK